MHYGDLRNTKIASLHTHALTMCGTCCMCAATFTLDGPRVLGRSCLGAAVGWTVTKDRTPRMRHEESSNEHRGS